MSENEQPGVTEIREHPPLSYEREITAGPPTSADFLWRCAMISRRADSIRNFLLAGNCGCRDPIPTFVEQSFLLTGMMLVSAVYFLSWINTLEEYDG